MIMIKTILIIIWLLAGFCLISTGCRGILSAEKLEASVVIASPGYPLPETGDKIVTTSETEKQKATNGNEKTDH